MIYIIIALALALALALYLNNKSRRQYMHRTNMLRDLLITAYSDYNALERGRDEEQEAYEQMYLSHMERILQLESNLEVVKEDRQLAFVLAVWHEMHCLPDLELISVNGLVNKEDWESLKLRMGVLTG